MRSHGTAVVQMWMIGFHTYALELMLCLHIFNQTGLSRLVGCSVPLSVYHIKMEESSAFSKAKTSELAVFSVCFGFLLTTPVVHGASEKAVNRPPIF